MKEHLSVAEENYLKVIFKISERTNVAARTSGIAESLSTSAASVTDMLQKLADKNLINYEKYKGATLTSTGNKIATNLVRKHRLWEVFLVDKLRFSWEKIHDIAEELEHIDDDELISRLDAFLDYPRFDPHGDPIPNAEGKFTIRSQSVLSEMHQGLKGQLIGVREHSKEFLQHLNKISIQLGSIIEVLSVNNFDGSMEVKLNQETETILSKRITDNLLLKVIRI